MHNNIPWRGLIHNLKLIFEARWIASSRDLTALSQLNRDRIATLVATKRVKSRQVATSRDKSRFSASLCVGSGDPNLCIFILIYAPVGEKLPCKEECVGLNKLSRDWIFAACKQKNGYVKSLDVKPQVDYAAADIYIPSVLNHAAKELAHIKLHKSMLIF